MSRFFIGVSVPREQAAVLSSIQRRAEQIARTTYGYRDLAVSHGNSPLHITLVSPFDEYVYEEAFGTEMRRHPVESSLARASAAMKSFEIELGRVALYADNTIYATVGKKSRGQFQEMRRALHQELCILLTRPEVEFNPHVSLARRFSPEQLPSLMQSFEEATMPKTPFPIRFTVDQIVAFTKDGDEWRERHICLFP